QLGACRRRGRPSGAGRVEAAHGSADQREGRSFLLSLSRAFSELDRADHKGKSASGLRDGGDDQQRTGSQERQSAGSEARTSVEDGGWIALESGDRVCGKSCLTAAETASGYRTSTSTASDGKLVIPSAARNLVLDGSLASNEIPRYARNDKPWGVSAACSFEELRRVGGAIPLWQEYWFWTDITRPHWHSRARRAGPGIGSRSGQTRVCLRPPSSLVIAGLVSTIRSQPTTRTRSLPQFSTLLASTRLTSSYPPRIGRCSRYRSSALASKESAALPCPRARPSWPPPTNIRRLNWHAAWELLFRAPGS